MRDWNRQKQNGGGQEIKTDKEKLGERERDVRQRNTRFLILLSFTNCS